MSADQRPPFVKVLIYGPPGVGKTRLLGTAQADVETGEHDLRTYPMLYLSFEGGELTLQGLDIDIRRITDWEGYNRAYAELSDPKTKYRSVAIDSLSETHVFALLNLLDSEARERTDKDLLQLQDYGRAVVQMRRLVRHFRDLPLHVFFTAHSKEDIEPREGIVKKPNFAGVLSDEIAGMMDTLTYLTLAKDDKGTIHRVLLLQGYTGIRAKTRTPWGVQIPNELTDPTIPKLMDLLRIPKPVEQLVLPGLGQDQQGIRKE